MKDHLLSIGIMTGNSLDAADVVLTAFHDDGAIKDLEFFSLPSPPELAASLRHLRAFINEKNGDMAVVAATYRSADTPPKSFDDVLNDYMNFIAQAVQGLRDKAEKNTAIDKKYDVRAIDVIGFHGQTCAHLPGSVAKDGGATYTVQIGDGQKLADLTGIAVVYDFRSDDLMQGGEGAPLVPTHNKHCAEMLKKTGDFPITFINGGNTSNLAHITYKTDGAVALTGWDAGPFNHFPDFLTRTYAGKPCDKDGAIGKTGHINEQLLAELFAQSAVDSQGGNFLTKTPPKSGDPQWYKTTPGLRDETIPLADRVRTAEYFAAYLTYHTLGHTPADYNLPATYAVFGGGWKNPLILDDFETLLQGRFSERPVLPGHRQWFAEIDCRLKATGRPSTVKWSNDYGFDGQAMEARIWADMARCRITNTPFTEKSTTGVATPTVCGVLRFPGGDEKRGTVNLRAWLKRYQPLDAAKDVVFDGRWSRASAGWRARQAA